MGMALGTQSLCANAKRSGVGGEGSGGGQPPHPRDIFGKMKNGTRQDWSLRTFSLKAVSKTACFSGLASVCCCDFQSS